MLTWSPWETARLSVFDEPLNPWLLIIKVNVSNPKDSVVWELLIGIDLGFVAIPAA
jgi:hypothetical protein